MKFETTPAFDSDYRRLKAEHAAEFKKVVRDSFVPAFAADPATPWPGLLRIRAVRGAAGVLEMTWSFASPDGRATFEFATVDGELRVRWRRVGDHDVSRARRAETTRRSPALDVNLGNAARALGTRQLRPGA